MFSSQLGASSFGSFALAAIESFPPSTPLAPPLSRTFSAEECMCASTPSMAAAYLTPQEVIDYAINWANELDAGETVTASAWSAPGITITTPAPTIQAFGQATTVWFSGGTVGTQGIASNTVTTSSGRVLGPAAFAYYVNAYNSVNI